MPLFLPRRPFDKKLATFICDLVALVERENASKGRSRFCLLLGVFPEC